MHDAAAGFERRAKGIRERVDIPAYRPAGDCAGVCAAGRSQSGAPGCVEQQERSGTYGAGADVCRSPCLCTGRDAAGGHDCGGANLRVVSGTRSFVARSHAGQRAASAIFAQPSAGDNCQKSGDDPENRPHHPAHHSGAPSAPPFRRSRASGADAFDIPFNRQQLEDYLCVDRSALPSELSRAQRDGMLRFHKKHFELCRPAQKQVPKIP